MSPTPTPPAQPPYYAVVFTSLRHPGGGADGYADTAAMMVDLAAQQPGYLGMDSARGEDGLGITVSYWRDEESIAAWRREVAHAQARRRGREGWYEAFVVHVAKVERAYAFEADLDAHR